MNSNKDNTGNFSHRFRELQEKFQALEPKIENSETKQALSIVSGMLQELWRNMSKISRPSGEGISLNDVADMYQNAPRMNGTAISKPLEPGLPAPDFALKDADSTIIKLSDFKGSPALIVFYPLDWSPGCSQQLDLYQYELDEFEKRGVRVLAISVDSIYSHGAWAAVRKISFPLLADFNPKGEVARKYNVYREPDGFSERALYLVDRQGIIKYSYVSPYLHHIPDIYQLFKQIDSILKAEKV